MLNRLIYIFLTVAAVLTATPLKAESLKAAIDSSQITMGYQVAIRFDIVGAAGKPADILVDKSAMPPEVEVVDWVYGDTTDLGNGLVEMKRALIVQSFDSGVYTIPPFLMATGPDTLRTNPITLKVNPVDVSQMTDIHPIAPALEFESRWYDFLPDWITAYWVWIFVGVLLIATAICAYFLTRSNVKIPFIPQPKPVPPAELALRRLAELRDANLWQNGGEKQYYTALIDILRDYLQGRFGINAMEMTSSQITRVLNENEATRMPNKLMKQILEIADFVKFAKVRPLPGDNTRAMNDAVRFVEDTRPVEVPEGADAGVPSAAGASAAPAAPLQPAAAPRNQGAQPPRK